MIRIVLWWIRKGTIKNACQCSSIETSFEKFAECLYATDIIIRNGELQSIAVINNWASDKGFGVFALIRNYYEQSKYFPCVVLWNKLIEYLQKPNHRSWCAPKFNNRSAQHDSRHQMMNFCRINFRYEFIFFTEIHRRGAQENWQIFSAFLRGLFEW